MLHKVTRQEEEIQTLERFVKNIGEKFTVKLVSYSGIKNPDDINDVFYDGIPYQITYGDSEYLGESRKTISKKGIFSNIRSRPINYCSEIIEKSLKKKNYMSGEGIILLIDCDYTGAYSLLERKDLCKKYLLEHKDLKGSWQHIFLVFPDGNIELC